MHVDQAIAAGAVAVLVPDQPTEGASVPVVAVSDLAVRRSELAARFWASKQGRLLFGGYRH